MSKKGVSIGARRARRAANKGFFGMVGVALVATLTAVANAAPPPNAPPPPPSATPAPVRPALPWKLGPARIALGNDLTLALPADDQFLAPPDAGKLLEKLGSFHHENLLGLVAHQGDEDWFVTVRYQPEGFIKDDEPIDAAELLSAIREGVSEANEERTQKGFTALRIDGWSDPPRYDKSVHHLVWALDVSDDDGKSVNFNTRILGRRGYVSVNLVTAPEKLAEYKPRAAALLVATTFGAGARYEDFDGKTDKVAEYGLAGLVLGGAGLAAAKVVKVGILAKFSKVILAAIIAGKKAIIALGVALIAILKKVLTGRKVEPVPAGGPPPPEDPPVA
jgi:uncharacterized membrane-anchored protein